MYSQKLEYQEIPKVGRKIEAELIALPMIQERLMLAVNNFLRPLGSQA
jgi:hypothetical protein